MVPVKEIELDPGGQDRGGVGAAHEGVFDSSKETTRRCVEIASGASRPRNDGGGGFALLLGEAIQGIVGKPFHLA